MQVNVQKSFLNIGFGSVSLKEAQVAHDATNRNGIQLGQILQKKH